MISVMRAAAWPTNFRVPILLLVGLMHFSFCVTISILPFHSATAMIKAPIKNSRHLLQQSPMNHFAFSNIDCY